MQKPRETVRRVIKEASDHLDQTSNGKTTVSDGSAYPSLGKRRDLSSIGWEHEHSIICERLFESEFTGTDEANSSSYRAAKFSRV